MATTPSAARPRISRRVALCWRGNERMGLLPVCSALLDGHVLVRCGIGMALDQPEAGLADALAQAVDEGELPDRRVDRALVQDLLDLVQERRAFFLVELDRLLGEQRVDLGVVAVDVGAALDREALEPGRSVAKGAGRALDDVLELLLGVGGEE